MKLFLKIFIIILFISEIKFDFFCCVTARIPVNINANCRESEHELPRIIHEFWSQRRACLTRYLNNPTRNVVPCGVACTPSYQRLEETPPCRIVASLRDAFVLQACNFTTLHSLRSLSMVLPKFSISDAVWKLLIHGQLYDNSCEHKTRMAVNYP